MTIKEAFQQFLGVEVDSRAVELALLNAGLDGTSEYSATLLPIVEKSTIDLLFQSIAVTSESESQYSTSKDANLMRERLLYLARKYGRGDILKAMASTARVKDISRMR